jgi:hypothetical protein
MALCTGEEEMKEKDNLKVQKNLKGAKNITKRRRSQPAAASERALGQSSEGWLNFMKSTASSKGSSRYNKTNSKINRCLRL